MHSNFCVTLGISILKLGHLHGVSFEGLELVLERAHFISSLSFIEFQTVEFEHVSSSTFARVF